MELQKKVGKRLGVSMVGGTCVSWIETERPQTLAHTARPCPASSRHPWKLISFGRTTQAGISSLGEVGKGIVGLRQTLLDMDMEGQNRNSTVPLCAGHISCCSLETANASH